MAYCRWFNEHDGAHFIIHPSCEFLNEQFKHNQYHLVRHSKLDRMLGRTSYLKTILKKTGEVCFFYSYGIPISMRVASVNWFHLSSVLPLVRQRYGFGYLQITRYAYLGALIRACLSRCDVISAESKYSLGLLPEKYRDKFVLSVNGSDDEISAYASSAGDSQLGDIAVVLGTYKYKALNESYEVFKYLEQKNPGLRMLIVGNKASVPKFLAAAYEVDLIGELPRSDVLELLSRARFYISTTKIENSFNAAAEGIFLTHQSYISIIPPHFELLEGLPYQLIRIPSLAEPLMHVQRGSVDNRNLRPWSEIIGDVVEKVDTMLSSVEK